MRYPGKLLFFPVFFSTFLFVLPLRAQETQQPTPAQEEAAVTGFCRATTSQDLWSGPSKNFKKVREVPAGHLLQVIGERGDYYRVLVPDGFQCYISADYLEVDADSMGTVTGSRVNLRSIPGIKGDFPIYQVDRGARLYVWERVGEWYCVTAPEDAYAYIAKSDATMVPDSAELEQELAELKGRRVSSWQSHLGLMRHKAEEEEQTQAQGAQLERLEGSASEGFKSANLEETLAGYKELADSAGDEEVRRIADARAGEIQAMITAKQAEDALKVKEEAWRKERDALTKSQSEKDALMKHPKPATHKSEGEGRQVTVVGVVDVQGPMIVLRGGKSLADVLYRIEAPDGRYDLGDFRSRRVSVLGRIGDLITQDQPPLVVVERLEILQ